MKAITERRETERKNEIQPKIIARDEVQHLLICAERSQENDECQSIHPPFHLSLCIPTEEAVY